MNKYIVKKVVRRRRIEHVNLRNGTIRYTPVHTCYNEYVECPVVYCATCLSSSALEPTARLYLFRGCVFYRGSGRFCSYWFFFFSSRRRHTRLVSDWSSDVCSSDLGDCDGYTFQWIDRGA